MPQATITITDNQSGSANIKVEFLPAGTNDSSLAHGIAADLLLHIANTQKISNESVDGTPSVGLQRLAAAKKAEAEATQLILPPGVGGQKIIKH